MTTNIRIQYKDQLGHQILLLKKMRPHGGYLVDCEGNKDGTIKDPNPDDETMNGLIIRGKHATTFGVNAFITLVRDLLSLDLHIEAATEAHSSIVDAFWENYGWSADEDAAFKKDLLKRIFDIDQLPFPFPKAAIRFVDLLQLPTLRHIIVDNPAFQLYCTHGAKRTPATADEEASAWDWVEIDSETKKTLERGIPFADGTSLEDYINNKFKRRARRGDHEFHYFAGRPDFIRVDYLRHEASTTKFADMRSFKLRAECAWIDEGQWRQGTHDTLYLLTAVVQLQPTAEQVLTPLARSDTTTSAHIGQRVKKPPLKC